MNFGFSYIGLIFLILLFIPNLFWTKHKPKDYDRYVLHENKFLLALERIGEVSVTCLVLIFRDFNIQGISGRLLWLSAAVICMFLYEVFWIRYFKSDKTMRDFYSALCHIPVAGATLPVIAFFCLAIYGKNVFLVIADILLGIGHIGIHLNHRREIQSK